MQVRSIIFDMEGVLIDPEPVHKLAKERALERFGISFPEDVYEKYKGRPDDTMIIEVVQSRRVLVLFGSLGARAPQRLRTWSAWS